MAKISCIIPVHNTSEYLPDCLNSLLRQSHTDFEAICINDFSTDDSSEVLERYQSKDARIRAFTNQYQGGAANARNYGLTLANGEYVIFLDSDDTFEPDLLRCLMEACEQNEAEVAMCGYYAYLSDGTHLPRNSVTEYKSLLKEYPLITKSERLRYLAKIVEPTAWNKLVKKSLLAKYKITFQDVPNANDLYFSWIVTLLADRVVAVDACAVNYRLLRRNGLTSIGGKKYTAAALDALLDFYGKQSISGEQKRQLVNSILIHLYTAYESVSPAAKDTMREELRTVYFPKWKLNKYSETDFYTANLYNFYLDIMQGKQPQGYFSSLLQSEPQKLEALVSKLHGENKQIALWGCGRFGQELLVEADKLGIRLDAVIDQNPQLQGQSYCGYIIESYEKVQDKIQVILITNSKWRQGILDTVQERQQVLDLMFLLEN